MFVSFKGNLKKLKHKNEGFSLIELIVVLGIFVMVMMMTTQILASVLKNKNLVETKVALSREGDTITNAVKRESIWARDILSPDCSNPSTQFTSIVLENYDSNLFSFTCDIDNNKFILSRVKVDPNNPANNTVTDSNLFNQNSGIIIDKCYFTCTDDKGRHSLSFNLNLSNKGTAKSEDFSMSVVLRNSK